MRYKGLVSKVMLALFVLSFFILGYLGTIHATPVTTAAAPDLHDHLFRVLRTDAVVYAGREDQDSAGAGDMTAVAKRLTAGLFACIAVGPTYAAESTMELEPMAPNLRDKPSLQRGMALYMNYCIGCHSLKFQRYERTADDLGVPPRSRSRTSFSPISRLVD